MTFLDAAERLISKRTPKWLLGFRRVARPTDERTAIFAVIPLFAAGDSIFLLSSAFPDNESLLVANTSSFVFDYAVRQKLGGTNMSFFYAQQFPVQPPSSYSPADANFVVPRVHELSATSKEIINFAGGKVSTGVLARWDDGRRFLLRCELDAFYFRHYCIPRGDVDYIMDTFPIVRRKDEQQFGEYRTKRVILEIYDAMVDADHTGLAYQTRLDPPPVDPRVANPSIVEATEGL